jgi:hypothetical protein
MSVNCYEMVDSMSGSVTNESEGGEVREVKRRWVIGQCNGFDEAVEQIEVYAPQYSDAPGGYWVRRRLDVAGIGNRYFDCTATYQTFQLKPGQDDDNQGGNPTPGSLAWDTTGNTERIYQALEETRHPVDADQMEEAINVNGGSVEGVDVVRPGMRYSETWIVPADVAMDFDFLGDVNRLTGTVNDSTFRAFEAGEALFMGARCQYQGDQPYASITFEFECRPNVDDFYVKGQGQFAKDGWDYVWIRYRDAVNGTSLVRRPIAAYVNRVYKRVDWSGLRITDSTVGGAKTGLIPSSPTTAQAVGAFFS